MCGNAAAVEGILEKLVDRVVSLRIEVFRALVGENFLDEHLAEGNRQLIDQLSDAELAVGNDILVPEKDLADVQAALLQLLLCDEEGLEELAKELDIVPQKTPQKKKNGDWRGLSHDSIPFEVERNGTKILFGKSAKQNDCLTFLLDTAKEHPWLHVNGTTGSHVMIKKENPSDEDIRTACEIALLNSGKQDGDILLTLRKNVRKGNVMGLAIVKDAKTIHLKNIRSETIILLSTATRMNL